jgi:hypothetical protein
MAGAPGAVGFFAFLAVKAAGYTAMAYVLKRGYGLRESPTPNVWAVGLARTGIGIVAGLTYGGIWAVLLNKLIIESPERWFYSLLLPVRVVEWSLLIWLFFDRGLHDRSRLWKYVGLGILCSYVLDVIGVALVFVIPGGIWVC